MRVFGEVIWYGRLVWYLTVRILLAFALIGFTLKGA